MFLSTPRYLNGSTSGRCSSGIMNVVVFAPREFTVVRMLLRRHHVGLGERDGGVAGREADDRVGDRHPVVRPVRPVGDAVVGRDELVGVVLALHRRRDAVVERRDDAADREVLSQEALAERVPGHRVPVGGEAQLVRRRRRRVVGELAPARR